MNAKKILKPIALFSIFAAIPLFSGCQSSCTGDARFDGYYCARSNLSNGVYAEQTNDLRRTADSRQAQESTLRRQYNNAQARLRAARANAATPTADVLRLEREVNSLQRALDQYVG